MSIDSNISEKDLKYLVAMSTFLKFGPKKIFYLKQRFHNMEEAFFAPVNELLKAGLSQKLAYEFIEHRKNIHPDAEMEKLGSEGIAALPISHERYPKLLRQIYDAPPILYCKGSLDALQAPCLAVVGSRKCTTYGQKAAAVIAKDCAAMGLCVVSGLAFGIDAESHKAALSASGLTIAVLGSGVNENSVFPASNRRLAQEIIQNGGALVSEFPFGTPALKYHFPQRNRIIAGLSLGVLVVEAAEKSGALITARYALEYDREVFAVPGSIFSPGSRGVHELLRFGAKLTAGAPDILEEFSLVKISTKQQSLSAVPKNENEQKIFNALSGENLHANQLAKMTNLDTATINATLITMELKAIVKNLGGGNYALN